MKTVLVAEKPSVAKDIAAVVGAKQKKPGYFQGNGYQITWALGHLIGLGQPHEMNPEWKNWRLHKLPIVPDQWTLLINKHTKSQFDQVKELLIDPKTTKVICATDAGREGELIFRYIYEKTGCTTPVDRLWISSLTENAIKTGLKNLRPASDFDTLAASAKARSRADWLVGMNFSRAYSLVHGDVYSIGRVQTPTLAMLANREHEIKDFEPEPFTEIKGRFSIALELPPKVEQSLEASEFDAWFIEKRHVTNILQQNPKRKAAFDWTKDRRLKESLSQAKDIKERFSLGHAEIVSLQDQEQNWPPPLNYDLTELQRHANRLYGFSAQKTLDLAQNLYERKKCISYPRTDSRYIGTEEAKTAAKIAQKVREPYLLLIDPDTGHKSLGKRFVDDSKITDHHAIIPTDVKVKKLERDEARIYDLICRRFLGAWQDNYRSSVSTVIATLSQNEHCDHYIAKGSRILNMGWKLLDEDLARKTNKNQKSEQSLPTKMAMKQALRPLKALIREGSTKPPPFMTEARLLSGMQSAGSTLEEKDLANAMKDCGLGTPATRAAVIENLEKKQYIYRDGRHLRVHDKGLQLISLVSEELKSPKMTGQWEARLEQVRAGSLSFTQFMSEIQSHVENLVAKLKVLGKSSHMRSKGDEKPASGLDQIKKSPQSSLAEASTNKKKVPVNHELSDVKIDIESILHRRFKLKQFRSPQKKVCQALVAGHDVLLVMPTGAGKSLCYQLPGLARQGTTLIVSPLIALMEDQVAKLNSLGFKAERIHSGRGREESREICRDYLRGHLDFLFVAPERLGLPGFMQVLSQKTLALVAIDEAHCISQWGHDFRGDYRKLGERLEHFRDVPKVALTATATTEVQRDILEQLSLGNCKKFIAGFRRSNIKLEIVSMPKPERVDAVLSFLEDAANRPAIIYALTRKETEHLAKAIKKRIPAEAYHAGLSNEHRHRVQSDFMAGKTDVVVATVAFGMGIDKNNIRTVIHLALPSSLAGYYQEIGRAGRDGEPSKAVLLYSYIDQKTHLFLHELNYPDLELLESLYKKIPKQGLSLEELQYSSDFNEQEAVMDKLWIHGALSYSQDQRVIRSKANWRSSYLQQKSFRLEQLESVWNFARERQICRMVQLIRYFGDTADSEPCGHCDLCAPNQSQFKSVRNASKQEKFVLDGLWRYIRDRKTWSKSAFYQYVSKKKVLVDRATFDLLLDSLIHTGYLESANASFKKGGKTISYEQLSIPHPSVAKKPSNWDDLNIIH